MDENLVTLQKFAKLIRRRVRNDKQFVAAITGPTGVGKSTFTILESALVDGRFNLKKNVSFYPDEKEVLLEFNALRRYQVYILDEAIKVMFKHEWHSKLQQVLMKMFATERWQNKIVFICVPSFWDLSANFRNERINMWIHIPERGHAFVYQKDDDKDNKFDPWLSEEALKAKEKALKHYHNMSSISKEKRYHIERRLRNYVCEIKFPDLPDEIKKEYLKLKEESRKKMNIADSSPLSMREQKYYSAIRKLLLFFGDQYQTKDLANVSGLPKELVTRLKSKANEEKMEVDAVKKEKEKDKALRELVEGTSEDDKASPGKGGETNYK